jgi:hypothetical protein
VTSDTSVDLLLILLTAALDSRDTPNTGSEHSALAKASAAGVQAYSNTVVNFTSEKLCSDALKAMQAEFKTPEGSPIKITLRGVCVQREDP